MMLKRPYDDPRVMVLVSAIRTHYNVWGWLLVISIVLLNGLILRGDYEGMRMAAFATPDYKVTGYEVEDRKDSYYIEVEIENHSDEECAPWILEIKNEKKETVDLLRVQRYFRFKSMNGTMNSASAIPARARGAITFIIAKNQFAEDDQIYVTFNNADITEMKIELP